MAHQNIKIAQDFVDGIPHSKALGMTVVSVGEGEFVMEMPYNPDYIGDPATGVIHGGAVFALLDFVLWRGRYFAPRTQRGHSND